MFGLFAKNFRHVCQNCILHQHMYTLKEKIPFEKNNFLFSKDFRIRAKYLVLLLKKLLQVCQKSVQLSRETFWGKVFRKIFNYIFHTVLESFSDFSQEFLAGMSTLLSMSPSEHFERYLIRKISEILKFWSSRETFPARLSKLHFTCV